MLDLHISSDMQLTAADVVRFLAARGIACTGTDTVSAVEDPSVLDTAALDAVSAPALRLERGVHLLLHCDAPSFRKFWPDMKKAFALRCGHVSERSRGFSGCTENFMQESLCPWCKKAEKK